MPSFQISLSPNRRAAARFIDHVRTTLQIAVSKSGISQSDIARSLGIHRSVVNRELKGYQDITMGRVAEIAWTIGMKPTFALESKPLEGANIPQIRSVVSETSKKKVIFNPHKNISEAA
jgi:IS30 family transposase